MQFTVIAYDGADEGGLDRRMKARPAHLQLLEEMKQQGKVLYALAMLNDADKMIGGVVVCDFESRAELDAWLSKEPYVTGKVWEKIEIKPCRVAPMFAPVQKT